MARRVLPTWRYWAGVLIGCPVALAAGAGLGVSLDGDDPWGLVAAWAAVLVVALIGVLHERRIREMAMGWRAVWIVVGAVCTGAVALALFAAEFVVACSTGDNGCG